MISSSSSPSSSLFWTQQQQQPPPPRFFTSNSTSSRKLLLERLQQIPPPIAAVASLVFVVGGILTTKSIYNHLLLQQIGQQQHAKRSGPRKDASRAMVTISTAAYEKANSSTSTSGSITSVTTKLLQQKQQQKLLKENHNIGDNGDDKDSDDEDDNDNNQRLGKIMTSVDVNALNEFIQQQKNFLQNAKRTSQQQSAQRLQEELKEALADAEQRIGIFSDWYFAYKTTYTLLGIAMTSAAKHAMTFRTTKTLSQAVTEELQAHVGRKYEAIVLRPAITDPKVHRAFSRTIKAAHGDYITMIQNFETSVSNFVAKEAKEYALPPRKDDIVIDMDWSAQLQKVEHVPLTYEKNPELSLAIVGAGAAAGKIAGGAAVGGAIKMLSAKLAAPFATKAAASTLAKAAATGAAGGALAGGPVGSAAGAAAGAAIGLGLDVTVNAGVALMNKAAFEKDVKDSLDATIVEWVEQLLPELERVQEIWFGHAEALLRTNDTPSASNEIQK